MLHKYIKIIKHSKNANVFIASMMVGLFVLAVFLFESYASYQTELENAKINSRNITKVLEEQISGSFQKIDLTLLYLQDYFSKEADLTSEKSVIYNQLLLTHKNRLSEVLSIKVVDQNGEYIGDDLGFLSNATLSDREYFQYAKNTAKNELIISKPVISKSVHVWIVVLSRPILSKDGQFRGLIIATVPLSYFNGMFSALEISQGGVAVLYGFDHFVYGRVPVSEKYLGKSVNLNSQLDLLKGDREFITLRSTSPIDGVDRILSAGKISNFKFIVVVGLAVKDILKEWKIRTIIYIVLIVILFLGFAFFLLNFLHSLELLEDQRKHAIQSAKLTSLGEMASGIAHEINNPLTIISAIATTMRRPLGKNEADDKLNSAIERILTTVDRIAKIIKGLRLFAKDSSNEPFVVTSIQQIIDTTLDLCYERLRINKIELQILPFNDQKIRCREEQIVQVLMNLLNNSVDALEHCSDKWIKIKITNFDNKTSIAVADSGKKIPEEVISKIMQPFFTTKEIGKGTGLGLSVSKGIIESHNGNFYLETKATHTTFIIELPTNI